MCLPTICERGCASPFHDGLCVSSNWRWLPRKTTRWLSLLTKERSTGKDLTREYGVWRACYREHWRFSLRRYSSYDCIVVRRSGLVFDGNIVDNNNRI